MRRLALDPATDLKMGLVGPRALMGFSIATSTISGHPTYIATQEGWLYVAAVLDLFSRRIVGWAMDHQMTDSLTRRALQMALYQRKPLTAPCCTILTAAVSTPVTTINGSSSTTASV